MIKVNFQRKVKKIIAESMMIRGLRPQRKMQRKWALISARMGLQGSKMTKRRICLIMHLL